MCGSSPLFKAPVKTTLVTILLSALAAGAYFGYRVLGPGMESPPASETLPESDDAPPSMLADTMPEFALSTLAGQRQSINSWPGRALIVNFWATWCPPCLREIPLLKDFAAAHDGRLQVVGIAVDQPDAVAAFAEGMGFNYPVLIGQSDALEAAAAFGVDFVGLPFTIFTDPAGRLLGVRTGELRSEHLEEFLHVVDELAAERIGIAEARARLAGRM